MSRCPRMPNRWQRLAQFEAERTRLLAAAGIRSVIGNFGTGQPDLALWPHFRPALEAAIEHRGLPGPARVQRADHAVRHTAGPAGLGHRSGAGRAG